MGELRRQREPWYIRMFQPFWKKQDSFSLVFPPGAGLDDRKLLVGSLFLVDITHYPTQATCRWGALALLAFMFLGGGTDDEDNRSRRVRSFDSPYDRPTYELRDE